VAIKTALPVDFGVVFPHGAAVTTDVEPVMVFENGRSTGRQDIDKTTDLPVWQVTVMDGDPDVKGPSKSVKVKILAKVQPVPPPGLAGFESIRPVEFIGMAARAYVTEVMQGRWKVAWSLSAREMVPPMTAAQVAQKSPAPAGK
jgi:hypothetical protein